MPTDQTIYGVVDTNVLLDIFSCHDLADLYNEVAGGRSEQEVVNGEPSVLYRMRRARSSLLLAMHFNKVSAITFQLSSEALTLLVRRVPPAKGGMIFEPDYVRFFVDFVSPRILPNWKSATDPSLAAAEGNEADRLLVEAARARDVPLITNEGYTMRGVENVKMRKHAKDVGVAPFTPAEFLATKDVNEGELIHAFLGRFRNKAPDYLRDRNRKFRNRDQADRVLRLIIGYYRFVLVGEHALVQKR